ncbi:MAG: CoB--CoM heterodisulfide reductase iron-sulfur subunit B family protein [Proteobacteria bacterium]|nr:CoB--CoM heterodisulfide reductase iron-sulfur subunit B family protein [Pseudomonadota bacterium]
MEQFGMYLGCNIPFNAPDIEQSFRQTFPNLGVEVVDLQGATCCPAWGTAPSFDINTWLAISSRNITLAESEQVDIMTGCNSCFGILAEAKHMLDHDPGRKAQVNRLLSKADRKYSGSSEVYHVAHVLHNKIGVEKINASAKYTLRQLKVAVQPGCHLLWPSAVMKVKEKNPFFPTMLKELCHALGAETPHYSRLESCCGMGAMRSTNQERALDTLKDKLKSMKEEIDPDMIVTTCSSCYLQFDNAQKLLRDKGEIDFAIPVFYYTQLLALCQGLDPAQVAAISETPRDEIIVRIQSKQRLLN